LVALFSTYYNFARVDKTLRMSPGMAAGVSKRLWEMSDIVALVEAADASKPTTRGPHKKRPTVASLVYVKEVIMVDNVMYRFNGQSCYEVDAWKIKRIRVVFGMIDENRMSMAWYLFSSSGVAKSKGELSNRDNMPP
jgi:hypothetical protein